MKYHQIKDKKMGTIFRPHPIQKDIITVY